MIPPNALPPSLLNLNAKSKVKLTPCFYVRLDCPDCGQMRIMQRSMPEIAGTCPGCGAEQCLQSLMGSGQTTRTLPVHEVVDDKKREQRRQPAPTLWI